jgi:uncharacterized protein (UPF0212 family)
VEDTQKIASPPHRGVAREALTLRIGEAEQVVEVERQDRINGTQGYWRCPRCEALRSHLYVVGGVLACRVCLGLDYRSRHVPRAVARAAKLRRKLGAAPGLLSPIPPKPAHWSPVYYRRLVAELVAAEYVLRDMLGATVRALERRKGRLHGPR